MDRRFSILRLTGVWVLLFSLVTLPTLADETRTTGILATGTPFETRWHLFDSGEAGPTVVITGGMHGNEPAGVRAARQISGWTVSRGRLVVVPRLNEPALAAQQRRIPGLTDDAGDLNRHFPRRDGEAAPTSEQGARIWAFVCAQEPDVLVDLHEGYGVRAAGSKSVGSSVLTLRAEDQAHQQMMLDAVNVEIDDPKQRFTDIDSIVAGSLSRAAIEQLGIEAHILETTHQGQPLSVRCRQHRRMVAALLVELEMADASVGTLINHDDDKVKVALYDGPGAGGDPQGRLFERILSNYRVERIGPADVADGALGQFDAVLFPGGSGSVQGKALGESGRAEVCRFIDSGGGYMGVCAGAYLALHNYDWGLKLLPFDSHDRKHWRRGKGTVVMETTAAAESILGLDPRKSLEIHFAQGPLMVPATGSDLPEPEVLCYFRSGIGIDGADPETMVDTPAIVAGRYGSGRVILFSPHPEKTTGLETLIERAALWGANAPSPVRRRRRSIKPSGTRQRRSGSRLATFRSSTFTHSIASGRR